MEKKDVSDDIIQKLKNLLFDVDNDDVNGSLTESPSAGKSSLVQRTLLYCNIGSLVREKFNIMKTV